MRSTRRANRHPLALALAGLADNSGLRISGNLGGLPRHLTRPGRGPSRQCPRALGIAALADGHHRDQPDYNPLTVLLDAALTSIESAPTTNNRAHEWQQTLRLSANGAPATGSVFASWPLRAPPS
jgi:hypothetical protein